MEDNKNKKNTHDKTSTSKDADKKTSEKKSKGNVPKNAKQSSSKKGANADKKKQEEGSIKISTSNESKSSVNREEESSKKNEKHTFLLFNVLHHDKGVSSYLESSASDFEDLLDNICALFIERLASLNRENHAIKKSNRLMRMFISILLGISIAMTVLVVSLMNTSTQQSTIDNTKNKTQQNIQLKDENGNTIILPVEDKDSIRSMNEGKYNIMPCGYADLSTTCHQLSITL